MIAAALLATAAAISAEPADQAAACAASVGSGLLYRCASAPIDQRADDLLSKMSPTEIIQQTWAPYGGTAAGLYSLIGKNGVGQASFGRAQGSSIQARVEARNDIQKRVMASSAHGVPVSFSNEALHSAIAGGTVFPELVTQGATWDVELIEEIGNAIAEEATACGIDTAYSPVLNMWVDSRFGRLQEGYCENPTLTAAYATAQVRGLQGEQPQGKWAYFNNSKMVSLGKHYAAYGAALGGLNGAPAELSERTLREWYLAPWRAFAEAGGKAVMTSHNTVLNQPMHANDHVTNSILRGEFGFGDGFIISDCNDIPALVSFRVAANLSHAGAKGIKGGVDLDLQCGDQAAYTHLAEAISEGLTTLDNVKRNARRVLQAKFALGLFEKPMAEAAAAQAALNTPAHRALALRAAEEGVVLLKNERHVLPLAPAMKKIAVVGGNGGCAAPDAQPKTSAQCTAALTGKCGRLSSKVGQCVSCVEENWGAMGKLCSPTDAQSFCHYSPDGGGACDGRTQLLGSYTQFDGSVEVPTVYEALKNATAGRAVVEYAFGAGASSQAPAAAAQHREAAVQLASRSDVVVAVLGDDAKSSSEWGDRDNLDLPGDQMPLLNALAATGKPIVLVLVTGRTATFGPDNAVLDNVTAVFSAFRPGQMGGVAIANLLTGKANPSGKLAQNWVRNAGQSMSGASPWLQWRVGKWVANHRSPTDPDGRVYDPYNDGPATPLFHFGHGLSYTSFAMSGMKATTMPSGPVALVVELTAANTGKVAGTTVVQVYCIDPVMDYVRPWKRLLAFARVTLAAGQSKPVRIEVTAAQLAFQDDSSAAGKFSVVNGDYQVRVGDSSMTDTLTANVTVSYTADTKQEL